jgi:hypothetical protein
MKHPNGAVSITEVIVCVQDPQCVAEKYAVYTDQSVRRCGASLVIEFGDSRIIVVGPDHLDDVLPGQTPPTIPFLAGFTVSSDLDTTQRWFDGKGIDFRIHGDRVLVNAGDGYGAAVLFENAATPS